MADPPVGPGTNATSWPERVAASAIPTVLGGAAFAVPFLHVREVASWAGQPMWAAWPIAISIELIAIASALEIRYRRRRGAGIVLPVAALLLGIAMSAACNLAAAGPNALPTDSQGRGIHTGHWVQVMALWPVVAFLAIGGMKATRPAVQNTVQTVHETVNTPPDEAPGPHLVPALPEPEDELLHVARVLIADAAANGRPIARTRLGAKIREAGFQVGAQRALSLYDAAVAA